MYPSTSHEAPDYIIEAIPGARVAFDAWANSIDSDESKALKRTQRQVLDSHAGKYIYRNGLPVQMGNTTHAELDAMIAESRKADKAVADYVARTKALRLAYDRIMTPDAFVAADGAALAARQAVAFQNEAAAAFATLLRVLPLRDGAYRAAGSPGRGAWSALPGVMLHRGTAEYFFREAIDGFDVQAIEAVGGLGDHPAALLRNVLTPRKSSETPVPA